MLVVTTPKGEHNPQAKLTRDHVIRGLRVWKDDMTSPTVQDMADYWSVSRRRAHDILSKRAWTHVTADDPLTHEVRTPEAQGK